MYACIDMCDCVNVWEFLCMCLLIRGTYILSKLKE